MQEVTHWSAFDEIACHQILEACPNAHLYYDDHFSTDTINVLHIIASRLHGCATLHSMELSDTDAEKLTLYMAKLDHVSCIVVDLESE